MKVFCQHSTGVRKGKNAQRMKCSNPCDEDNSKWLVASPSVIWNSDFSRPRKAARVLSCCQIFRSVRGSKRARYLTNVSVSVPQIANQNASSGDGAPADDNTNWIDPWIENEPDPHNDVVTKVTMRHAQVMWISRARHVYVVCASPVKLVLSLSEISGKKYSSDLVYSTRYTYVFQISGPSTFY